MNTRTTNGYAQMMLLTYEDMLRRDRGDKPLTVGEAARLIKKHEARRGLLFNNAS